MGVYFLNVFRENAKTIKKSLFLKRKICQPLDKIGKNMELHEKDELLSKSVFRWAIVFEKSLARTKDEKTIENYLNVVNKFQNFLEMYPEFDEKSYENIDHNFLNEYLDFRDIEHNKKTGKKLNATTKQNDKKVLKLFFEYLEDENDERFEFIIKWKKVGKTFPITC